MKLYNRWISGTFDRLGFSNIEMITDVAKITYEQLSSFGSIYIGGGNSFRLLKLFKETRFYDLLAKYINNNHGLIYGGSAGAILFGHSISTARLGEQKDPELPYFTDYTSYNFIRGMDVDVHYFPRHDTEVHKYVKIHNRPVISIPEESAIHVSLDQNSKTVIRAIGDQPVYIFNNQGKSILDAISV
jgi:dipeptidase E